jgi:hypothetical protein
MTKIQVDSNNKVIMLGGKALVASEGGVTPTGTLNITQNGTYDVTNYASANVNVSGGGGGTTYSYPDIQGNYYVLDDETVVPMCFDTMTFAGNSYSYATFFTTPDGIGICQNLSTKMFHNGNGTTGIVSNTTLNTDGMLGPKTVKHISISFPDSIITSLTFSGDTFNQLSIKNSLQSVRISNMKNLKFLTAFRQCSLLSEVDMSTVDSMPLANALGGSAATGGAFAYCTSLQTLSFPALKSTSFGSYTSQFNYMLRGVTGCTVHFPSNLQSVISSWNSVTTGFGGTNTTVLFDLPATT